MIYPWANPLLAKGNLLPTGKLAQKLAQKGGSIHKKAARHIFL
jgi:hypothetical protein